MARQKHRSFPGKESLSSIPVCTGHVYVFTATSAVRTALALLYKPDSFSFLLLARYLYIYRKDPLSARNALEMLILRGGVIKAHDLSMSVKLSTSIRKPGASQ